MNKPKLTERQRKFVDIYLECGNASRAAAEAGFAPAYAAGVVRHEAVQEYMAERRKQMPAQPTEVINFLVAVMRGNIKASQLRVDAAYEVGKRAGVWRSRNEAEKKIKEAAANE